MRLFYNPDCSKSNAALDLLKEQRQDVSVILYCENPPSIGDLRDLIEILDSPVQELVRTKEKLYQETYPDAELTEEKVIEILMAHPELMERPILIVNDKAIIARPPQKVLELIKK